MEKPTIQPWDTHNQKLATNVHPPDWVNPEPASRYNLVVIGAGTAGLVTAAGSAGLGARVALVERDLMGGDCLNVGCVPSKALIASARAVANVRNAAELGIQVPAGVRVDFPVVMERMRRLRADLSPIDSAARFRSLGVDVFLGDARFVDGDTVEVDGRRLAFRKAVIATGARATAPPIPGLAEAGYLTNETVFSLTELPRRIAVVGAGPIGCELAQAFARFGSRVTLLEVMDQILIREDRDAAAIVDRRLRSDGIELVLGAKISAAERRGAERIVRYERGGQAGELVVDEILIGVGRAPNVERLNLEAVGVEYDTKNGIRVNDELVTTNPRIYAAGDVCSPYKFTHHSDAMARIVIQNALFPSLPLGVGRARASTLTLPWVTYTDPEIAHVGLYEGEAREKGISVQTFTQELREVDRAILEGETDGFARVHIREGSDEIVGATIVASHAGDMISEVTLAMVAGAGLGTLARTIHPYPTQADAIRKTADAYNRTRLTARTKSILEQWFRWTR